MHKSIVLSNFLVYFHCSVICCTDKEKIFQINEMVRVPSVSSWLTPPKSGLARREERWIDPGGTLFFFQMLDTLRALRASEGIGERTNTPHHSLRDNHTHFCTVNNTKCNSGGGKRINLFWPFTKQLERVLWRSAGRQEMDRRERVIVCSRFMTP